MCAHVKDPISICRKRVGITADGVETRKDCTHDISLIELVFNAQSTAKVIIIRGKKQKTKLVSATVLWLLAFPHGKQPEI